MMDGSPLSLVFKDFILVSAYLNITSSSSCSSSSSVLSSSVVFLQLHSAGLKCIADYNWEDGFLPLDAGIMLGNWLLSRSLRFNGGLVGSKSFFLSIIIIIIVIMVTFFFLVPIILITIITFFPSWSRVLTAALLHGSPMDSAQLADALARGVRMERPLGPQGVFPWGCGLGFQNFVDLCPFL